LHDVSSVVIVVQRTLEEVRWLIFFET